MALFAVVAQQRTKFTRQITESFRHLVPDLFEYFEPSVDVVSAPILVRLNLIKETVERRYRLLIYGINFFNCRCRKKYSLFGVISYEFLMRFLNRLPTLFFMICLQLAQISLRNPRAWCEVLSSGHMFRR